MSEDPHGWNYCPTLEQYAADLKRLAAPDPLTEHERHARTREGMQAHFSRPEIAARFQEACARSENTDPLTELRTGLHALLAETVRLFDIADANSWSTLRTALSMAESELREAAREADTIGLQRGIEDTHEGHVYPWPDGALGTDAAAEAANASGQAHSPVSGDCGSEGTR